MSEATRREVLVDMDYHSLVVRFLVHGAKGTAQFVFRVRPDSTRWVADDLGYHARVPQFPDHTPMPRPCDMLGGAPCYYDGTSLRADDLLDAFRVQGAIAVWTELTSWYARMEPTEGGAL